jgi:hypothetical protein
MEDVILTGSCDLDKYASLKEDLYKYKISADTLNYLGEYQIEVPIE